MLGGFEHTLDLTGPLGRRRRRACSPPARSASAASASRSAPRACGWSRTRIRRSTSEGRAPAAGRALAAPGARASAAARRAPAARARRDARPQPRRRPAGAAQHARAVRRASGITGVVVAPRDGATRTALEAAGFPVHIRGEHHLDDVETYEGRIGELVGWAAPQGFDAVLVNTMVAFVGGDVAERLGLPAMWIVHASYGLDGFWATFPERWLSPHVRDRGVASFSAASAIVFEADATRRLFEPDAAEGTCLDDPLRHRRRRARRLEADWTRASAPRDGLRRRRAADPLRRHDRAAQGADPARRGVRARRARGTRTPVWCCSARATTAMSARRDRRRGACAE